VREGDQLPFKGKKVFKSAESLRSGGPNAIRFKLWEGEIKDPITDNNFVGVFAIKGSDFAEGVIAAGSELVCEYEISDSGAIYLNISVPSIGGAFESGRNFYSRQESQIDYSAANDLILEDLRSTFSRLDSMSDVIFDEKLDDARKKLTEADNQRSENSNITAEEAKQAADRVLEAKRLMANARKNHLKEIRSIELEKTKSFFDEYMREYARSSEISTFDNLIKSATRAIEKTTGEFEVLLDEMRSTNSAILWRQDWYILDRFQAYKKSPQMFNDKSS
jgi:molecular chaperone DnaK